MFLWPCVSAMAVDLERDAKRQCCEPPAPHVSDVGALTDNVRKKALELLHRSFQETTDRSSDAKYAINVSDISETLELAVFKKFPVPVNIVRKCVPSRPPSDGAQQR